MVKVTTPRGGEAKQHSSGVRVDVAEGILYVYDNNSGPGGAVGLIACYAAGEWRSAVVETNATA